MDNCLEMSLMTLAQHFTLQRRSAAEMLCGQWLAGLARQAVCLVVVLGPGPWPGLTAEGRCGLCGLCCGNCVCGVKSQCR